MKFKSPGFYAVAGLVFGITMLAIVAIQSRSHTQNENIQVAQANQPTATVTQEKIVQSVTPMLTATIGYVNTEVIKVTPTANATATAKAALDISRMQTAVLKQHQATLQAALTATKLAEPTATLAPTWTSVATKLAAQAAVETATQPAMTPSPMPVALTAAPEATATTEPTLPPPTETPTVLPTEAPTPTPAVAPVSAPARVPRLVLGNYFAWYDGDGWDDCNISAGDKPLQPYSSDDPAAIRRQVETALNAGLDGFTLHWFAPGERTDANMAKLLEQSQGTGFQSTVVFLRHIWHGNPAPTQQNVAEAISYIINQYGGHPNFLRLNGKPVIFFVDMYRVPVSGGQSPVDAWGAIRQMVDPGHNTIWIAEGLDASYLSVFDGLYVYKVTHAAYPNDYTKASRWAAQVRQWEQKTGQQKLWIANITPGYDDTRAGCKPDVRAPSAPHRLEREDGAFYNATYAAAMQSNPDWLWVQSFNEWVEGTYIEPSVQYGDRYLNLTRDFAQQFKQN